MSARDEAIATALATGVPIHKGYIAEVLDAVPGDMLVRLAIERGALARVEIIDEWAGSSEIIDLATKRYVDGPLYRLVEP